MNNNKDASGKFARKTGSKSDNVDAAFKEMTDAKKHYFETREAFNQASEREAKAENEFKKAMEEFHAQTR